MRNLETNDLPILKEILEDTEAFNLAEVECAVELLEIVLQDPEQKDYIVAVADRDGVAVGYVLYGPVPLTEGHYDIYWIATSPAVQGQGYGRKLMTYVENDVLMRNARMISLETSSKGSYERTRQFYLKAGYRVEAKIIDFYTVGDHRLTFVKRLSDEEG